MPGETHLLMVQDADHSMATGLEQVVTLALPYSTIAIVLPYM